MLAFLNRMPKWIIGVAVLALGLLGVLLPYAWAGIFLIALAGFASWLLALSWPVVNGGSRALRIAVIAVVFIFGVARIAGWVD